jgi:hypothetical protein
MYEGVWRQIKAFEFQVINYEFCTYYSEITNWCNFLFYIFISLFSNLYPTCFGLSQAHHQGYLKLFSYILVQPFGSCSIYVVHLRVPVVLFVVVASLYCFLISLVCFFYFSLLLAAFIPKLRIPTAINFTITTNSLANNFIYMAISFDHKLGSLLGHDPSWGSKPIAK